ncbi:MAG: hypothetical protein OMM_03721 [Candidatus Magnetoglobus multicellularis str. Araruama]|uniref:Uncharacterized protein n=1 Tax=Candidatus Magnetoglobus multicellularis str. Araruama TaxID=890399 RepID=A0A1V1P4K8_9BACT|nr:MAG: hypothetical protein OMM_03721 [Candidatus Magnetoglobus multicellularis str. Araruama]
MIPFYFEIMEANQWLRDFSRDYFLTFINQYLAFKTRNKSYIQMMKDFPVAMKAAKKENFDDIAEWIYHVEKRFHNDSVNSLWVMVVDAPRYIVENSDNKILHMIDEFQHINRYIFKDQDCEKRIDKLAGTYFHTCEYRNAPFLVSGSWVGWLMDDLNKQLPGRFIKYPMGNMPENESVETIFKYAKIYNVPVTEQSAYLMAQLTEGNPFYIDGLFRSKNQNKDFTTKQGILETLEYETLSLNGSINNTWMEYLEAAFDKINDVHAKQMVIFLSKNRDRRVGHSEIREKLGLEMTDPELEKKLKALYRSDIIEEDSGLYKGVGDNIFDKIFRRSYSDDITSFITLEAPKEYKELIDKWEDKYKKAQGELNLYKGKYLEFMVWNHLEHAYKNQELYNEMFFGLPDGFVFEKFEKILSYTAPPLNTIQFQIDVFARPEQGAYALIGEVKNRRQDAPFTIDEAKAFVQKAEELVRIERIEKSILFVVSMGGFRNNALEYIKKNQIAWSSDDRWLVHC